METNAVYQNGNYKINSSEIDWAAHPKFAGVYMKNVLTGKDTDNRFSSHIVKIEPGCEIGNHIHEGKTELHEIIEGQGTALVNDKKIDYTLGVVSLIPDSVPHEIKSGEKGLLLLAKFIPALN